MPDGTIIGWEEEKVLDIFNRNIEAQPLMSQHDIDIEEQAMFTILALQAEAESREEHTEQEDEETNKDQLHTNISWSPTRMQVDEELEAPILKRQHSEATMAPQDLPKTSGIDLMPKASAPPITLRELTSEEVILIFQEEEDQRNALILELEQEEEEQRMQIQEDEE